MCHCCRHISPGLSSRNAEARTHTIHSGPDGRHPDQLDEPRRLVPLPIQSGILVLDLAVEHDVVGKRRVNHSRPPEADQVAVAISDGLLHPDATAKPAGDQQRDVGELLANSPCKLEEEGLASLGAVCLFLVLWCLVAQHHLRCQSDLCHTLGAGPSSHPCALLPCWEKKGGNKRDPKTYSGILKAPPTDLHKVHSSLDHRPHLLQPLPHRALPFTSPPGQPDDQHYSA